MNESKDSQQVIGTMPSEEVKAISNEAIGSQSKSREPLVSSSIEGQVTVIDKDGNTLSSQEPVGLGSHKPTQESQDRMMRDIVERYRDKSPQVISALLKSIGMTAGQLGYKAMNELLTRMQAGAKFSNHELNGIATMMISQGQRTLTNLPNEPEVEPDWSLGDSLIDL